MVKRFLIAAMLLLASLPVCSQLLEFSQAIKLSPAVNGPGEEGLPLLSPDGKKLFFTRALYEGNHGGTYGGQDIWMSEFTPTGWKRAVNTFDVNNKYNNVLSGISVNGKVFYYLNASSFQRINGVYASTSLHRTRTRPELIAIPGIENQDFIGFYVAPDLDVIFLSMKTPETRGSEDLFYSVKEKNGLWSKPRNLGATVNTSGFEISPFLSADKKRLYFASNGHGGLGDADVFYCERLYDSWETWSVPVNLGSVVNSNKFDAYFSLYGDSVAYFASNRDGRYTDLYRTKARLGKTILEKGQRYLTREEWNQNVGKNVATDFAFAHQSSLLSQGQKELLFFIVNKLMLERDIRFHLVVKEEESEKVSQERLKAIYDHLKQLGIDPVRIHTDRVFDVVPSRRGVIEMKLFR